MPVAPKKGHAGRLYANVMKTGRRGARAGDSTVPIPSGAATRPADRSHEKNRRKIPAAILPKLEARRYA